MFGGIVRQWWTAPVDYVAQVEYFTKRTMSGAVQVMIGLGTGLNAVTSLVILLPFAGSPISHVVVAALAALQFFWAWRWCCRPWPTRVMSLAFVVSADIVIGVMAALDGNWLLGLFSFNAFAMLSVYLMFFDGPKVLAGHAVWIVLATTAFAVRVSAISRFDRIAFITCTLGVVVPVVTTALGVQLAIWAMRNDANEAVTDPLTGLLNRRGLHLHIGDLLGDSTVDTEVAVMVLDLDSFKDINDSFGHTVGDHVLTRCARRIKSAVRGSALVARVGGEEFVVVDVVEPGSDVQRDFDRVRVAIGAPAEPAVTASAGVTTVALAGLAGPGGDPAALLDAIIERADRAMFVAKRDGGNATIHMEPADNDG
ncbi:GGDEF domain-containing protein [soil metagenome]